ncbi:zinc-binding alcohol dehydrogenase family protein [Aspergillus undulatus]|uniref:zinc-binding alcohol dehydrogenase family protein n=1 Tax=Aspergillus undulatus TaxID=1810928 RepID=UPI003CCD8729
MRAITVSRYGPESNLQSQEVPHPEEPQGRDLLVRVKACSVNPVDVKVRAGTYDDYPDYYTLVTRPYQICGFDGAGKVIATGPESTLFSVGDEVFYSGSPIRQGSNAEFQHVDERVVGHKPKSLNMVQAAAMPLTYVTAYEALVERLQIQKGEQAAVLIINGAGGVGAVATQIAKRVLELPVVVTTASRNETVNFSREMGATHVVNHHGDLGAAGAICRYIFIAHSTDRHLAACAKICAPFGKVCSIVQGQVQMYGTEFMAKSLSFIWALLGTKSVYGVDQITHHETLGELAQLADSGLIQCHLTRELDLNVEGLREAHRLVGGGGVRGKVGLGIPQSKDFKPFT